MQDMFNAALAKEAFGNPADPGYIYLMRDRGRYKVGRTKSPKHRLRVAKTWIPDIEVIGLKPFWFHKELEAYVHVGLATFAYKGEWFDFEGDEFEETFINEFKFFADHNPISNTRSFTYFVNGTGMNELTLEWSCQGNSKRRFLKETSFHSTYRLK